MEPREREESNLDNRIKTIYEDVFEMTFVKGDGRQLNFLCPLCGDNKPDHFYVNADDGRWYCHKCGEGGGIKSLAAKLEKEEALREAEMSRAREVFGKVRHTAPEGNAPGGVAPVASDPATSPTTPPASPAPVSAPPPTGTPPVDTFTRSEILTDFADTCHDSLTGMALEEMSKRLSPRTLEHFKIGLVDRSALYRLVNLKKHDRSAIARAGIADDKDPDLPRWAGSFLIPFVEGSNIVSVEYRLRGPEAELYGKYQALRGAQRRMFNGDALKESPRVFLTEGAIDAMTMWERGFRPAVGLPSGMFKEEWVPLFERVRTVYLILDNDEVGERTRKKIHQLLRGKRLVDVRLPDGIKDANDFFRKAGRTKAELWRIIREAAAAEWNKGMPTPLIGLLDDFEDMLRLRSRRRLLGLDTGFEELNNLTMGFHGLNVIGGEPGAGKTSFCLQVGCQIAEREDVPFIYISVEMPKSQLIEKIYCREGEYGLKVLSFNVAMAGAGGIAGKVRTAIGRYGRRVILLDKTDRLSLLGIEDLIRRLCSKEKNPSAFVVIDSLQAMANYMNLSERSYYRQEKERIDSIISWISYLVQDTKCVAAVISHKPKGSLKKETQGVFLGSVTIDYEADNTFLLVEDREEPPDVILKFTSLKQRYTKKGDVLFRFRGEISKFVEMPTCTVLRAIP